jgi:hypothetical protein
MASIELFGTRGDLLELLQFVEWGDVAFTECGDCHGGLEVPIKRFAGDFADFAIPQSGDSVQNKSYLVFPSDCPPAARLVKLKNGGVRYLLDQYINPESIVLRPGGHLGQSVISGQAGTASTHPTSTRLFKALKRAVRSLFTQVGSYWVGKEAELLLRSGARLTASTASPAEYDLKLVAE